MNNFSKNYLENLEKMKENSNNLLKTEDKKYIYGYLLEFVLFWIYNFSIYNILFN